MKFKRLALLATFATIGLSAMTLVAHAEGDTPPAAVPAPDVAAESNEFKMFRFATRMDKLEFIKQAMHLNAEQEKKFYMEQRDLDQFKAFLSDNVVRLP